MMDRVFFCAGHKPRAAGVAWPRRVTGRNSMLLLGHGFTLSAFQFAICNVYSLLCQNLYILIARHHCRRSIAETKLGIVRQRPGSRWMSLRNAASAVFWKGVPCRPLLGDKTPHPLG